MFVLGKFNPIATVGKGVASANGLDLIDCEGGRIVGINGRKGALIDSIQLVCEKI